jgi:Abnormal spindle-like microcephaly-assoc'd, ASPM-SPD-2-Hydin
MAQRTMGLRRHRMPAVLLAVAGALLVGAAGASAEEEVDGTPPVITNGVLSPSSLPSSGGNVQISVDIIDESGVQNTTAQVYGSDGSYQAISLYQGSGDTYYGTFEAPANFSEGTVSYGVEVQAYDLFNNYNSSATGEVQVEGQPQFDEAPWISMTELWPQFLPAEGGTVTISAEAGDNRGLSAVYATITPVSGGAGAEVGLNGVSSSRFEGSYEVPANTGPLAAEYLVEVVVQDDIGQEGRALAGTITVEPPPPPPSTGLLEVSPLERAFGQVAVGKQKTQTVFVRNLRRGGAEPVAATARLFGSPAFSLDGAPAGGIHFVLAPGQKRAFKVTFRPTVAGEQAAMLEVARDDGAQPNLGVSLVGQGVAKR